MSVDDELESLLPPLSDDKNSEPLRSIAKDGFTDPIIVWLNHDIMVDGHNRHQIWRDVYARDEDKSPQIVEKHFATRDDMTEFMLDRQLVRRNLTDAMRGTLALLLKPMIEASAKQKQVAAGGDCTSGRTCPLILAESIVETRKELATAAGVGVETVCKVEAVLYLTREAKAHFQRFGN